MTIIEKVEIDDSAYLSYPLRIEKHAIQNRIMRSSES